jgi:hypothetical protein
MNHDNREQVESIVRIYLACGGDDVPTRDKLELLSAVWLCVASQARNEALIAPGGFPVERDRQSAMLRSFADLVDADQPDVEMERLFLEGDIDGVVRRVRDVLANADPDPDQRGES